MLICRSPRRSSSSIVEAAGNFGGAAPAAVDRVELPAQRAMTASIAAASNDASEGASSAPPPRRAAISAAGGADLVALAVPRVADRLEHLRPARHAVAGLGGK